MSLLCRCAPGQHDLQPVEVGDHRRLRIPLGPIDTVLNVVSFVGGAIRFLGSVIAEDKDTPVKNICDIEVDDVKVKCGDLLEYRCGAQKDEKSFTVQG
jgi:hypothetical protein